jgi:hypothetical protein
MMARQANEMAEVSVRAKEQFSLVSMMGQEVVENWELVLGQQLELE